MRSVVLLVLCLCGVVLFPLPARAAPDLCESAALGAAAETGVPADLMLAITLAETGRRHQGRLRPWPWAANAGGRGYWFDSRAQALDFARAELAAGRALFDLGCFQINWHWHGAAFDTPADLLDPQRSARYAARFLSDLRAELGSWEAAAGAYHSRTPARAASYGARVAELRRGLSPDALAQLALTLPALAAPPAPAAPPPLPRDSALALLAPGAGPVAPGSLVSAGAATRPFLTLGGPR